MAEEEKKAAPVATFEPTAKNEMAVEEKKTTPVATFEPATKSAAPEPLAECEADHPMSAVFMIMHELMTAEEKKTSTTAAATSEPIATNVPIMTDATEKWAKQKVDEMTAKSRYNAYGVEILVKTISNLLASLFDQVKADPAKRAEFGEWLQKQYDATNSTAVHLVLSNYWRAVYA